jgi:hypothetical protein
MRFVSVAKRAKYVVAGHPKHVVMNGATPIVHPGLAARFFGNVCDTEKSQRELGWTNEEREVVEEYLLGHKDFNHPGGYYLEVAPDVVAPRGAPTATRCLAFFRNEAGESEQCPNTPEGDTDYCAQHQPVSAEA